MFIAISSNSEKDARFRRKEMTGIVSWVQMKGGGSQQLYYHDCLGRIPGHTTKEPQVGFKLETNSLQFYVIANLDKTDENDVDYHENDVDS